MANEKVQNFQNHARTFPPFHFFVLPVLLVNAIDRLVLLKNGISFASIMAVLVAFALLMLAFCARVFAVTVQDRVIRLEMQIRLARLLPADLRPRIEEFTVGQLVGLRFAGDDELPALARQVLDEKLADRKTIKSRVKHWRPDYLRC
jgi:hypothetical protein